MGKSSWNFLAPPVLGNGKIELKSKWTLTAPPRIELKPWKRHAKRVGIAQKNCAGDQVWCDSEPEIGTGNLEKENPAWLGRGLCDLAQSCTVIPARILWYPTTAVPAGGRSDPGIVWYRTIARAGTGRTPARGGGGGLCDIAHAV
jgi:hypothetical protein